MTLTRYALTVTNPRSFDYSYPAGSVVSGNEGALKLDAHAYFQFLGVYLSTIVLNASYTHERRLVIRKRQGRMRKVKEEMNKMI
jgi:hypothetical protein